MKAFCWEESSIGCSVRHRTGACHSMCRIQCLYYRVAPAFSCIAYWSPLIVTDVTGDGGLIVHLYTPHAVLRWTSWLPAVCWLGAHLWNIYSYVDEAPLTSVDPSGNSREPPTPLQICLEFEEDEHTAAAFLLSASLVAILGKCGDDYGSCLGGEEELKEIFPDVCLNCPGEYADCVAGAMARYARVMLLLLQNYEARIRRCHLLFGN